MAKTTTKTNKSKSVKKVNKEVKNDTSKTNNDINAKKRRIIILILLVLLLILILGSSTYAWFSSNKHATIEAIDINVATVSGMQVSTDAYDWGNEVTKEQIINAYKTYPNSTNQMPALMSNVSTAGGVTDGKLDMFFGVTSEERDGGFTLTTIKQKEKRCTGEEECMNQHYVAFDIFLLVTTPATIAITGNSSVIANPEAEDKGSQNAARVGFVVEGSVSEDAPAAAQNLNGGSSSLIWEPNYDVHSGFGVLAAKQVYGIETTKTGAPRLPYKGVNSAFQTPVYIDQTNKSSYFTNVNPKVATPKDFTSHQPLMSIPAGITKVRVYMWLEGQDVDMENNIASSKLIYNLELAMIN